MPISTCFTARCDIYSYKWIVPLEKSWLKSVWLQLCRNGFIPLHWTAVDRVSDPCSTSLHCCELPFSLGVVPLDDARGKHWKQFIPATRHHVGCSCHSALLPRPFASFTEPTLFTPVPFLSHHHTVTYSLHCSALPWSVLRPSLYIFHSLFDQTL